MGMPYRSHVLRSLFMLVLLAGDALANTWTLLQHTDSRDTYIDRASIKVDVTRGWVSDSVRTAVFKDVRKPPPSPTGRWVQYSIATMAFDCVGKRERMDAMTLYISDRSKEIQQMDNPLQWDAVDARGPGAEDLAFVCGATAY
jgi:hypothetical protein